MLDVCSDIALRMFGMLSLDGSGVGVDTVGNTTSCLTGNCSGTILSTAS